MKKVLRFFLIFLSISLLFGLARSGLFSKVEIVQKEMGPYNVVYKHYVGDYSGVGPVLDEVYYKLKEAGFETKREIGIYYDDPKTKDKNKLRSDVGVLLDDGQDYVNGEFERVGILRGKAVLAEFPYSSKMSIIFGALRVYPKLRRYINESGLQSGPIIEIYDLEAGKIQYISGLISPLPV